VTVEPAAFPAEAADPAAVAPSGVGVVNVANGLTLLRVLIVPVFVVLLAGHGGRVMSWRVGAFAGFAVASVTDRVDGYLARSRGLVTEVGKIADPIADKALIGAALLGLSALGELAWWVTAIVLAREIGVTVLRFVVIRHGVIPASHGGKLKTLLQSFAIGLYVLPWNGWLGTARFWLMAVAVVVTLVTGADYIARAVRLRRAGGLR
jgi:CDP-diacylglycerol--glycerol-3-phosphate 3-phosphatidyltransferase